MISEDAETIYQRAHRELTLVPDEPARVFREMDGTIANERTYNSDAMAGVLGGMASTRGRCEGLQDRLMDVLRQQTVMHWDEGTGGEGQKTWPGLLWKAAWWSAFMEAGICEENIDLLRKLSWLKVRSVGRPIIYRPLVTALEKTEVYHSGRIVQHAAERDLLTQFLEEGLCMKALRRRIRSALNYIRKRPQFPREGDAMVFIKGWPPSPGWYGWRWQRIYVFRIT